MRAVYRPRPTVAGWGRLWDRGSVIQTERHASPKGACRGPAYAAHAGPKTWHERPIMMLHICY